MRAVWGRGWPQQVTLTVRSRVTAGSSHWGPVPQLLQVLGQRNWCLLAQVGLALVPTPSPLAQGLWRVSRSFLGLAAVVQARFRRPPCNFALCTPPFPGAHGPCPAAECAFALCVTKHSYTSLVTSPAKQRSKRDFRQGLLQAPGRPQGGSPGPACWSLPRTFLGLDSSGTAGWRRWSNSHWLHLRGLGSLSLTHNLSQQRAGH